MGGDFGPSVTVSASLNFLLDHEDTNLVLIGDSARIEPLLTDLDAPTRSRLEVIHTSVCVLNESNPVDALRNFKESSMYLAVNLVKEKQADACVSAGNTGALLMIGRHILKTIPGISKPAIVASIPFPLAGGRGLLLDVGANVICDAQNFLEFAVMGSVLAASIKPGSNPRVALLNIGEEEHKGTEQIRLAAKLMERTETLQYIGYIEGNELFSGKADVIVCDGFSGNLSIKTSEGVVKVIAGLFRQGTTGNLMSRIAGLMALPLLNRMQAKIDPSQFNGASVLGLQGTIVKSHGSASVSGFQSAISQALREVKSDVPSIIQKQMTGILQPCVS
jgi:glycerol-3-phosphate acyltransferase PlsX